MRFRREAYSYSYGYSLNSKLVACALDRFLVSLMALAKVHVPGSELGTGLGTDLNLALAQRIALA